VPESDRVSVAEGRADAIHGGSHSPVDRDWDLVFFSYLHSYYEHTKALSAELRARA